MAITIMTDSPQELEGLIRQYLEERWIHSWIMDRDGDFTITRQQWANKAWFRVKGANSNSLILGIISSKQYPMTKELYGVYHGRMIATLLAYFDTLISNISCSSLPTCYDCV